MLSFSRDFPYDFINCAPVSCNLYDTTKCELISFEEIFETGEGTFYKVKVIFEDISGKEIKGIYLQEASDENMARISFKSNVKAGEITDFNKTKIMGIIK